MDRSVLDRLTKQQRDVCCLYFVQGMDQADIAVMLGIRQPAVSRRLSRANQILTRLGYPPLVRRQLPSSARHLRQMTDRLTAVL